MGGTLCRQISGLMNARPCPCIDVSRLTNWLDDILVIRVHWEWILITTCRGIHTSHDANSMSGFVSYAQKERGNS